MTASDITPIGSLYGAGQNGGDNNVVYQIVGQPLGVFYLPHCKGLKENELGGYSYDIEDLNDDGEIDFSDGGYSMARAWLIPICLYSLTTMY